MTEKRYALVLSGLAVLTGSHVSLMWLEIKLARRVQVLEERIAKPETIRIEEGPSIRIFEEVPLEVPLRPAEPLEDGSTLVAN